MAAAKCPAWRLWRTPTSWPPWLPAHVRTVALCTAWALPPKATICCSTPAPNACARMCPCWWATSAPPPLGRTTTPCCSSTPRAVTPCRARARPSWAMRWWRKWPCACPVQRQRWLPNFVFQERCMTRPPAPPRHLPPAELFSYDGPPQGDYVRYVEQLMAWAEREHARSAASAAPSASASIVPQPGARPPGALPLRADAASATGAVAPPNSVADIVRQVSARLQEQAAQRARPLPSGSKASAQKPTPVAPATIVFML